VSVGGGGVRAGVGGEVSKYKNTPIRSGEIFSEPRIFLYIFDIFIDCL
jgi:hypothetical protein